MKRKNLTRNALVTSIISLLLCVSMLVGTTFAWFTDEVVSGHNTIAAGNLDIELYHSNAKVTDESVEAVTDMFLDLNGEEILWEPGVVAYENLEIANEGTLALKYQLTLNVFDENDLNGHKLSEVLKVAILEDTEIAKSTSREQILELAKKELADDQGNGTLSNFYHTGDLEAEAENDKLAVVIFWAPNDNAVDNLYNANNGQKTSDDEPLHIKFGINLQATQKMSENDSFGYDYDASASILPKATVNNVTAEYSKVEATVNDWGNNAEVINWEPDIALQFLPNESLDAAKVSEYRNWHADYVIKADKDVSGIALGGYYRAFCGPEGDGSFNMNNGKWVILDPGTTVTPANTEVRLLETMLSGTTVNYELICQFGNDGTGFLCGVMDQTGENVGTTITVELRMYETYTAEEAQEKFGNHSTNYEKADYEPDADVKKYYEVIGTYTYTFGANTAADLQAALAAGNPEIKLDSDIVLADDEVLNVTGNTVIDLNGHTISGKSTTSTTSYMIKVASDAELTLTGNGTVSFYATTPDTEWGGEGQPPYPGYANNTIRCEGKLIIDGVTVENLTAPGGASYAIDCYQGSDLIVNSGVINGHGKCAIRMFCNSNTLSTNVTINGGTITGKRAIWVHLPGSNIANVRPVNLTINGGKLICTNTEKDVCVYSYSYGDSFANTNITITGGEFTGDVAFGGGSAKTTQENVTITGGTFNGEVGRWVTAEDWEVITVPTV